MSTADTRGFGLRARLLGLVVMVLVPWLALLLYTTADERRHAIANVDADAMRLIRIVSSNQAAQIEAARQLLTAFARMPQLRDADRDACSRFLGELLPAYPLYLNFALAEPDGTMSCSARALPAAAVNVADRAYFKRALATRDFAIGDYQVGRVTHVPAINYAYPVIDGTGDVKGVAFAAQSLNWLTAALAKLAFPSGAIMVVVDRNGTVLARMPTADGAIGARLAEPGLLETFATQDNGGVFEADDAQGNARLWAHAPLLSDVSLRAAIGVPKAIALADVNRRLTRNLIALGIVTLVALVVAWFGAEFFVLRPVGALVRATKELASGRLDVRVPSLGQRGELGLLARAFNAMAATLERRDRELRIAEENRRLAQVELAVARAHMDIARQIQRSMLPEDPLVMRGVAMAGRCIPAADVGGDYFGYFPRGASGIDSFLGDVSGHGVGAALLMAEARTTFLAERLVAASAGAILGKLNRLLYDDLDRAGQFMSACCATFDAKTGELCYANAGHPPAMLLRANEPRAQLLKADGLLLGFERDTAFGELRVQLHDDDIVAFYTDGVTEVGNADKKLFGAERLADAITAHRDEDPQALADRVLAELRRFAGADRFDDYVTIVIMKVPRGEARA
jgi:serine phosphatase RsbU (regulator of sigma subunit)